MYKTVEVTKSTRNVVEQTIPLIKEHGVSIVTEMYKHLFETNPDYKSFFNMNHQEDGDGSQIKDLANALLGYAIHFRNIDPLTNKVAKIVEKHTSLNILPAHYESVASSILHAIKKQFRLEDDDLILKEWGVAYWVLANHLIELESQKRDDNLQRKFGWKGFKKLKVGAVRRIGTDTIFIKFVDKMGGDLPKPEPGQYITLEIAELGCKRQYSLLFSEKKCYEIAVKRIKPSKDSISVSNYIYDYFEEGSEIPVSMPAGGFTFDHLDGPVCALSGGIGVTPHVSLFKYLQDRQYSYPYYHIHSMGSGSDDIDLLSDTIETTKALTVRLLTRASSEDKLGENYDFDGRIRDIVLSAILEDVEKTKYFVCGPVGFMKSVKYILEKLRVPSESVHFEYFGAEQALE